MTETITHTHGRGLLDFVDVEVLGVLVDDTAEKVKCIL